MRKLRPLLALVLLLATLATAACSRPAPTAEPQGQTASLEQVRRLAEVALDATLPGKQRQEAREAAMNALVAFLKQPESLTISQAEWEQPLKTGPRVLRYFASGDLRICTLTLPASGVVPPGERVAVQLAAGQGAPQAAELEVLPGGQLAAARALAGQGQYALTLAFTLALGGGYVVHYQRDRSGEFKRNAAAFRGLPPRVGDVSLNQKDGYLLVNMPLEGQWHPRFEEKRPLRLFFTADLGIDWKERFEILDERNFNAFQGFATALDPKAKAADRKEAWEKATHKFPAYLEEMPSWADDLAAKLPPGAGFRSDRLANLEARVVSVPAPDLVNEPGFTVVQYRTGNGMPSSQVIALPGVVTDFRLVNQNGLPGLLLLTGATGATGSAGVRRSALTLLLITGDNNWAPASDWIGALPVAPGLKLSAEGGHLMVEGSDASSVQLTGAGAGDRPAAQVCSAPGSCFTLSWTGAKFGGAGFLVERLRQIAVSPNVTYDETLQAVEAVRQFLQSPDTRALSSADLAAALGRDQGVPVAVFEAGPGAHVVGMPANAGGTAPVLVQSETGVLMEPVGPRSVVRWTDARVVEAGGARWLLVLGQSRSAAALLLYKWDGKGWQPANALDGSVDRILMERARISYSPGQVLPVRGLYTSGTAVSATFTPDGQGVQFCENGRACVTYQYNNRWSLK
jgi:hypothetical protein